MERAIISSTSHSNEWITNNGCSHHVTSDRRKFHEVEKYDSLMVRLGNNYLCTVVGKDIVSLNEFTNYEDVYLLESLK